MTKRAFDLLAAAIGLVLVSPLLILVAVAIRLDSPGPVLFRQRRVGRNFRPFEIYKFRTMVDGASRMGPSVTAGEDPRVTRVGRILRRTKIDELPQLINVIKGDMSLVGPRPELPKYVEMFRRDYEEILAVRPGMTDPASLVYHDEAELLGQVGDPEEEYIRNVLPAKIALARRYLARSSLLFDLAVIVKTVGTLGNAAIRRCFSRHTHRPVKRNSFRFSDTADTFNHAGTE